MKIITKVCTVIEKDNKILLIKEWSNKKNGYFLNLIKGTYGDVPNESLSECAEREAKEEACIDIEIERLMSYYVYSADDEVKMQFNFLAHPKQGGNFNIPSKKEQKSHNEDIIEIMWVDKNEVLKIPKKDFVSDKIFMVIEDRNKEKSYDYQVLTDEW